MCGTSACYRCLLWMVQCRAYLERRCLDQHVSALPCPHPPAPVKHQVPV